MDISLILQFLLATFLWSLIWLERGIFNKNTQELDEKLSFWWIRTFSLISLFWAISCWVSLTLKSPAVLIASMIIVAVFTLTSYIYSTFKEWQIWLTTEIAVFLTYFLWVFVILWYEKTSIILSIILSFILSLKEFLNKFKSKISREEISNTLKFFVISFVVLPILPDHKYSIKELINLTWNTLDFSNWFLNMAFFNPYSIWFFVVIMSAVSYVWYVLSKIIWEKNSIVVSWAIGWLISSTAVTASMTDRSKKDAKNIDLYVVWTLVASLIMFIRVIFIVLFFNINLLNSIIVPSLFMVVWMGIYVYYFYCKSKKEKLNTEMEIENDYKSPFSIAPALKFAWFVLFIKFIAAVWSQYKDLWWNLFYYILWIISGLADVDAISQTMASDSKDWKLIWTVAVMTILIAVFSNNFVKWLIAWRFWEKRFWRSVMFGFIISMIFGILGMILLKFA